MKEEIGKVYVVEHSEGAYDYRFQLDAVFKNKGKAQEYIIENKKANPEYAFFITEKELI